MPPPPSDLQSDWIGPAAGDWSDGGDWNNGVPAAPGTSALLGGNGTYDVTIAAGENFSPDNVTLDDYTATLTVDGTLGTTGGITIESGVLWDSGSLLGPVLDTGGVLLDIGGGPFTLDNSVSLDGGTLSWLNTLTGTAEVTVPTGTVFTGFGAIDDATYLQPGYQPDGPTPTAQPVVLTNLGTIETTPSVVGVYSNNGLVFSNSTLVNDGLIEADGGVVDFEGQTFVNASGATIEGVGSFAVELDSAFSNAGLISETGGELELGDYGGSTWTNTGSIVANNATVLLGGNETQDDIGALTLTGTTILELIGTLENAGTTLNATSTLLAGLILDGGTIAGGTLDPTGLGMSLDPYADNWLDDVTVVNGLTIDSGDLTLADGSTVYTDDGVQTLATIVVTGSGGLGFAGDGSYTIQQDVTETGGEVVLTGSFTLDSTIAGTGGEVELGGPQGTIPTTWVNDSVLQLSGAAVELNGNETVAQIGSIVDPGGSISYVGGTLDNIGGTLNGSDTNLLGLQLDGATIEGGTLDAAGLGLGFGYNDYGFSNDLDNVTVINGLTVDSGSVTLTGTSAVYTDATAQTLATVDVGASGTLGFAGTADYTISQDVAASGGTVVLTGPFTLDSTIGETAGLIELGGPVGTPATTWVNDGLITLTGGSLELNGNETVAQIGSIADSGASILYIGGTLDNVNGTLNGSDTSLLGLQLDGGTIEGGTLDPTALGFGASELDYYDDYGISDLDNVAIINNLTVDAPLALTGSTAVYADSSATTPGSIVVTGYEAQVLFAGPGPFTLDSSVTLTEGQVTWAASTSSSGTGATVDATIAAGAVVSGDGWIGDPVNNSVVDLTNLGAIDADVSYENLTIAAASLVNDGLIETSNNGIVQLGTQTDVYDPTTGAYIEAVSTLENDGTIVLNGGSLLVQADATVAQLGSIINDGGSIVYQAGTLDNTGGTLNGSDTSLLGLQLDGGTIEGGTLDPTGLGLGVGYGYGGDTSDLDNVTIVNNLTVDGQLALSGSTTVYADTSATTLGSIVVNYGAQAIFVGPGQLTLDNPVTLEGGDLTWAASTGYSGVATTVGATIAAGDIVSGYGAIGEDVDDSTVDLTNLGTIGADSSYEDLNVTAASLVNDGLIEASNNGIVQLGSLTEVYDPTTQTDIEVASTLVNDGTIALNDGSLELDANATVAQLGSITNAGGSIFYQGGTLDNIGGTLNGSDTSLHGLQLDGGTIEGGTLDTTGLGFGVAYGQTSGLDNVTVVNNLTVAGPLALSGSTAVYADTSATTPGSITLDGFNAQVEFVGPGPFTLDNPVTLEGDGELTWAATNGFSNTPTTVEATIAAGDTVSGYGRIGGPVNESTVDLTNLGTIDADTRFDTLAVQAADLVNDGLIEASNGAAVQLGEVNSVYDPTTETYVDVASTLVNDGTIALDGGSLVLDVDATVAQLGSITNSGGTIYYQGGTLDNIGGTLNGSDTSLLGLQLDGGTIEGGTLDTSGLGFGVSGLDGATSDLDNVTIIDNLTVDGSLDLTGSTAVFDDPSAAPGTIDIDGDGAAVVFVGPGPVTLDNPVTLEGGELTWAVSAAFSTTSAMLDVTIAADDSVSGYGEIGSSVDNSTVDLANLGTIDADTAGQVLAVEVPFLNNDRLIEATDGGIVQIGSVVEVYDPTTETYIEVASTLINDGTIALDNGSLVLEVDATVAQLDGITNTGGSIFYQGGTLDNIGGTLNGSDTPLLGLQLDGGTIEGGTLDTTGLGFGVDYSGGNTSDLDNVTVVDNLTVSGSLDLTGSTAIYADASATTPGSITINGYDAAVVFVGAGPFTLDNPVTIVGGVLTWAAGTSYSFSSATLDVTIAAGNSVSGYGEVGESLDGSTIDLTNLGTLISNTAFNYLSIDASSFDNQGTLLAQNGGVLEVDSATLVNFAGGTLTGGSYVSDANSSVNFYSFAVTSDAADIVLNGAGAYNSVETTLTQIAPGGTLELDNGAVFSGSQAFSVTGLLTLGGGALNETSVSVATGGSLVGFGSVNAGALTGGGLIEAEGGTLTLDAPQSDGATVNVGAFAAVELTGADNAVVDMSGADGTVILDSGGSDFTGTIENFASGDAIVLNGFAGTGAVFSDGTLTVSNSTGSITVNVAGDFAANAFVANVTSPTESVISLGSGETIAVSAPGSLFDNPGTVIGVPGVTVTDSPGATFTVNVDAQYGVLAATPEDGGVAQGNGTGTLLLSGDLAAINAELATLEYLAPSVGTFTDTIVIDANDNSGGTASTLIDVTINQPPTIGLPADVLAQSGSAADVIGLSITDPDTVAGEIYSVIVADNAGLLQATAVSGADVIGNDSTAITLSGVLDSVNAELGNLTFTGTANDQLTILADDGRGGLREGFVPVDVNVPPTLSAPGTVQGFIGIAAPVSGVSMSDAYGAAVGDTFTATLVAGLGTLEVTSSGATIAGNDTGAVTITGSLSAVDNTLASLQYIGPEPGYTSDTIGVSVSDGHGGIESGTIDVIPPPPPTLTLPDKFVVGGGLETPLDGISVGVGAGLAADTMITLDLSDAVGTLGVMWDSGVTVGGNGTNDLVLTGEAGAIDTALASLVYTGGTSLDTSVSLDSLSFTASEDGATTSAIVPVNLPINGDNPSQPQSFAMLLLDSGLLGDLEYDNGNNAYVGTLYVDLPAHYAFEPPPTSGSITFSVLNDNIVTATDNASAYQEPYAPVVGDWETTGPFSAGGITGFFSTAQLITATDYTLKQPDTVTYIFKSTASDAGQLPDRRLTIVFNQTTSVTVQTTPTTSSSSGGGGGGGGHGGHGGGHGGRGGGGVGDVHLTTYDGLYYNFQAEGEFILAKSTQPGDLFQVQIRLQPWSSSATVSVITEAAVSVGTNQRVTFDITRSDIVQYNGTQLNLVTDGTPTDFGDATLQQLTATSWQILYDSGETVTISDEGTFLDVQTTIPPSTPAGSVEGLLGDDNGNPANDLVLSNGTVLPQPLTSAQLYTTFADSWRVTQSESLLDYGSGQTTATFTNLSFPSDSVSLSNLPPNILENAESLIAAAGITNPAAAESALEDYLLTGDPSFITAESGSTTPITAEMETPGTSSTNGLGIAALNPVETISVGGTTAVSFLVYQTGTSSVAETVGYSYTAQAPGLTEGLASTGTVTIGAGQTMAMLTLDLLGSLIGPSGTVDMVITAGTTGLPLLASTANVIVNNDTAVAGTPAEPMFVNAGTIGTLTANQSDTAFTLDIGNVLQGSSIGPLLIDIANQAIAPADTLAGSVTVEGSGVSFPDGFPSSISLVAGGIYDLTGHLDTANLGTIDRTITLDATDVNGSGYSSDLGAITLDILADVTCFREGTRILTPHGEIAIEELRTGDSVLTIEGAVRPIVWIGRRSVDCRRHPRPERVWPVRVAADAFGRGLPRRTLWLSPDHAVFVRGVLIPVRHLINGTSIVQQPVAHLRYFHIELEHHDIVRADGLPAETYLDTGDRSRFENGGLPVVLHPDFATRDVSALVWEAYGYARLVVVGPEVDAVRAALRVQAGRLAARHVARQVRRGAVGSRRRTG